MTKEKTPSTTWKRNLIVIWIAEFVAIVGFSVVLPLLPLYIQELGITDENQIALWSGLIFSAHAVLRSIFGPIWGALSDRYGRKIMVERAMFSGAVVVALMGFAQSVEQLTILRGLQGALTGTVTAATALVATSVPEERVGWALGTLQVAIYTGASVGPAIGGFIADNFGYRIDFWVTGALLLIAALGVLFFVREDFEPASAGGEDKNPDLPLHRRVRAYFSPLLASSLLIAVLGVRLIVRFGTRMISPVLPLFVQKTAAEGTQIASLTGLINGVSAGSAAAGAFVFGWLGDRMGARWLLIACMLFAGAFYTPQAFVENPRWLIPLQAGSGLALGGVLALLSASLARLAPTGQEGIIYGINDTVVSIANAIGPVMGSSIFAWLGLRAPFIFAAGFFVVAAIVSLRFLIRRDKKND